MLSTPMEIVTFSLPHRDIREIISAFRKQNVRKILWQESGNMLTYHCLLNDWRHLGCNYEKHTKEHSLESRLIMGLNFCILLFSTFSGTQRIGYKFQVNSVNLSVHPEHHVSLWTDVTIFEATESLH